MLSLKLKITNEPEAPEADTAIVRQGLRNFNNRFINDNGFQPLNLFLRREEGPSRAGC